MASPPSPSPSPLPSNEISPPPLPSPAFPPLLIISPLPPPPQQQPSSSSPPPNQQPLLAPPTPNPPPPPEATYSGPPPPSMPVEINPQPPSPPMDISPPPQTLSPPSPPPPPSTLTIITTPPPGPPLMLINETLQQPNPPPPMELSPPSSSSSTNGTSIGMIIGISIAVAGVFFIIAFILLCFCSRSRRVKLSKYFHDFESPPPLKDKLYAAPVPPPPPYLNKKTKHYLLQREISSSENSCSPRSVSENPFSPRALSNHAFGVSSGNFTYDELVAATGGFSESNLLGEGGFGYVHKGILPTGREIAVKQLKMGSRQGEREFQAEVETISRVHHKHLVSLVGYCINGIKRLLVYEYVPNKTLDFHLHGTIEPVMNWATRLKIAIGSAKGLAYLHEDCNPTIIHRDIKASNILLDSKYEAKVSDFGLAKFFSDANHYIGHVSTRVVGTFGYLAPEYAESGKTSYRSDVYSYGVMLLELITGRTPIMEPESSDSDSLVSWARPLLRRALEDKDFASLVDPRLQGNYNGQELATMVACAAACVRQSSWRRPRMSQMIRALEGNVSLEDLDEGIRPGQSTIAAFFDYDSDTYKEMSRLKMTMLTRENRIESSSDGSGEDDPHPRSSELSTHRKRSLAR